MYSKVIKIYAYIFVLLFYFICYVNIIFITFKYFASIHNKVSLHLSGGGGERGLGSEPLLLKGTSKEPPL